MLLLRQYPNLGNGRLAGGLFEVVANGVAVLIGVVLEVVERTGFEALGRQELFRLLAMRAA